MIFLALILIGLGPTILALWVAIGAIREARRVEKAEGDPGWKRAAKVRANIGYAILALVVLAFVGKNVGSGRATDPENLFVVTPFTYLQQLPGVSMLFLTALLLLWRGLRFRLSRMTSNWGESLGRRVAVVCVVGCLLADLAYVTWGYRPFMTWLLISVLKSIVSAP